LRSRWRYRRNSALCEGSEASAALLPQAHDGDARDQEDVVPHEERKDDARHDAQVGWRRKRSARAVGSTRGDVLASSCASRKESTVKPGGTGMEAIVLSGARIRYHEGQAARRGAGAVAAGWESRWERPPGASGPLPFEAAVARSRLGGRADPSAVHEGRYFACAQVHRMAERRITPTRRRSPPPARRLARTCHGEAHRTAFRSPRHATAGLRRSECGKTGRAAQRGQSRLRALIGLSPSQQDGHHPCTPTAVGSLAQHTLHGRRLLSRCRRSPHLPSSERPPRHVCCTTPL
jgi:hypothetical protein